MKPKAPPVSPIGQGRLGVAERLAVEEHSMQRAADWCRRNGWPIVEVKGTTGSKREVEVTKAEVRHARDNPQDTVLIVVTEIVLQRGAQPTATGGKLHAIQPWSPADSELSPTRYRWKGAGP